MSKKGGLAFLNKKKWHTGHIRNIERVWIAEQKHAEEQRKMMELKKQMIEEKQIAELRQLQAESGLISKSNLNRLDWMYQGHLAAQEQKQEEFLLGKEYVEDKEEEDINKVAKKSGSLFINKKVNHRLEAEARLRDDPLLAIMKEERNQRKQIMSNPVKMKAIRHKVDLLSQLKSAIRKEDKVRKKKKKKDKKGKKGKKKKKKKKTVQSSDSESEGEAAQAVENAKRLLRTHVERTQSAMSKRNSINKKEDKDKDGNPASILYRKAREGRERDEQRSDKDRRARSRSRSRGRGRGRGRSRSRSPRRERSRSSPARDRSRSSPARGRSRSSPARDRSRSSPARDRSRSRSRGRRRSRSDSRDRSRTGSRTGSRDGRRNGRDRSSDYNGSSKKRPRPSSSSSAHSRPAPQKRAKLTEAEKKARLAQMQADAKQHDEASLQRVLKSNKKGDEEEKAFLDRGTPHTNKASFIKDLNKNLYTSGEETVESRLKKYKHYRQQGNTEHHTFL